MREINHVAEAEGKRPIVFVTLVDREVLEMLDIAAVSYRLVLTKTDKIKASDLAAVHAATEAEARKHPAAHPEVIATSSEKGMGIAELRTAVLEAVES